MDTHTHTHTHTHTLKNMHTNNLHKIILRNQAHASRRHTPGLIVKIVYEDNIVLTLMSLHGDALQVQFGWLLSTLFSIAIPAKYKVTENTAHSHLLRTYQRDYIVTCCVSNRFHGLYSKLPRVSLKSCKLFHVVRSSAYVLSCVNLYLHWEIKDFPH